MKRVALTAAAVLLSVFLCSPTARAVDSFAAQWDAIGAEAVEDAAEGVVSQPLDTDIDLTQGITDLLALAQGQVTGALCSAFRSGILLLVVVLLAGVIGSLGVNAGPEMKNGVRMVAALAVTGLAVADAGGMIGLGKEAIGEIDVFSKLLLPVMTTACAAAGNVTGAAVRQTATLLCSDVLITLIDRVLIPFVYFYIAAAAAANMVGNAGLSAVAKLLKWGIKTALTTVLLAYTGFLSFAGMASGSADAVTIRLTKSAISGLVPVVGGILSDTTETLLAGAGMIRGAVGIFGVLAVLGFCLTPFLYLGVQYLMYRVVAVLAAVLSDSGLSGLIEEIGAAFGLVLGMTGACALMVLIALFAAMSAVLPA